MLASLRKLSTARLHLLSEHGRLDLLPDAVHACGAASSLIWGPCEPAWQARPFSAAGDGAVQEDEEVELTLPEDLGAIARLNPQLRDVMIAHQKYERESARGALRLRLQELVAAAEPGRAPAAALPRLSQSALSRLRVDQLRAELEEENADPRGTKDVLVGRLLALVAQREQQETHVLPNAEELPEGVVTRKQLAQQERRVARRKQSADTYGISEAALAEAQAAAVTNRAVYATVFQPEELAELLLDARAADVTIIDVRRRCPFTDYMVLGTARSQRLVQQIAGGVLHQLKQRCKEVAPGVHPSIEGSKEESEWMVVDAGSVVVHVFLEGWREEYDLEGLWGAPDGSNVRRLAPRQAVQTLHTITA